MLRLRSRMLRGAVGCSPVSFLSTLLLLLTLVSCSASTGDKVESRKLKLAPVQLFLLLESMLRNPTLVILLIDPE